jgi:murein DD-endopeptidase MepM/ murein hydrolase activator NlpD
MQTRRWRPVAALTLALVAAPFLAATAVAAQDGASRPAKTVSVPRITWLSATKSSVQKAVDTIVFAAAAVPAPPPLPAITDRTTWIWPGNGPVTSLFGRRWGRMHQGVDIDAAYGSAVVAAQRGTVIAAGWGQTGYGRVVQIDHGDGFVTLYAHLSAISVSAGQVVAQGDKIGAVGASGAVTAAHLHYEVHVNGVPRNPMPWLLRGGASSAGNPG